MSHGVDARGRVIMTKAVGPHAAGNAEHAGAILAVMLVDAEGVPVNLSSGGVSPSTFIYSQDAASAVWEVVHNLERYPSVTTVDSAGTPCIGDVDYHLDDPVKSGKVITITKCAPAIKLHALIELDRLNQTLGEVPPGRESVFLDILVRMDRALRAPNPATGLLEAHTSLKAALDYLTQHHAGDF